MNKSLFHIKNEYISFLEQISNDEGEITPEVEKSLAINKEELQHKSSNYVHVIKKLENDIELAKDYEEQIKIYKDRKRRTIEKLKESLKDAVGMFGDIETDIYKISIRKSECIQIDETYAIPAEYIRVKEIREPDKEALKRALKEGKEIKGVSLKENKNIQIK